MLIISEMLPLNVSWLLEEKQGRFVVFTSNPQLGAEAGPWWSKHCLIKCLGACNIQCGDFLFPLPEEKCRSHQRTPAGTEKRLKSFPRRSWKAGEEGRKRFRPLLAFFVAADDEELQDETPCPLPLCQTGHMHARTLSLTLTQSHKRGCRHIYLSCRHIGFGFSDILFNLNPVWNPLSRPLCFQAAEVKK